MCKKITNANNKIISHYDTKRFLAADNFFVLSRTKMYVQSKTNFVENPCTRPTILRQYGFFF